jgi:hypothetical protein
MNTATLLHNLLVGYPHSLLVMPRSRRTRSSLQEVQPSKTPHEARISQFTFNAFLVGRPTRNILPSESVSHRSGRASLRQSDGTGKAPPAPSEQCVWPTGCTGDSRRTSPWPDFPHLFSTIISTRRRLRQPLFGNQRGHQLAASDSPAQSTPLFLDPAPRDSAGCRVPPLSPNSLTGANLDLPSAPIPIW